MIHYTSEGIVFKTVLFLYSYGLQTNKFCRGSDEPSIVARILWFASLLRIIRGTSLVAQWLRIRLQMQGTRVRALVWEDPTCCGATKPVCHNYWACAPQLLKPSLPGAHTPQLLKPACSRACVLQLLSPCAATTEACTPRAHAPQRDRKSVV